MFYYAYLESMICGDLMPHKIPEEIFVNNDHFRFTVATCKNGICLYDIAHCNDYFVDEIPKTEKNLANISFEKKLLKDLSGQTWFPPTLKAYYYLTMINLEKSKIIEQYRFFYRATTNLDNTKFLMIKEINKISVLAKDLQIYTQSQVENLNKFKKSDPNHYVIYLLQETIIDLLLSIYKIFGDLLSLPVKNSKELRAELFEGEFLSPLKEQDKTREMVHNLFVDPLRKIYDEFNDDLFPCTTEHNFYILFEKENVNDKSFTILNKSKFYYLLHVMWESKLMEIKKKYPGFTKKSYLEPALKNCKLSFKSFDNRKTITDNLATSDPSFKKKVDILFK